MSYLIYINGSLVDLYPDTKIQLTLSNFNIGDILKRNAAISNSIKIPPTENNVRITGLYGLRSLSITPYSRSTIKVIQNGIEIFNGFCFVQNDSNELVITGLSNEILEIDTIKNTYLSEITTLGTGTLSDATFYSIRNGSSGIYCPVINYGKLTTPMNTYLDNDTFASGLDPWVNEDFNSGDINWTYNGGSAAAEVLLTLEEDSTVLFNPDFIFYAGIKYQITLDFNLSSNESVTVFTVTKQENVVTDIDSTAYTTSGDKTLVINHYPQDNIKQNGVGIYINLTGGGSITMLLRSVSILADYDTFIELKHPFYLPCSHYMTVLNEAVKQTITGGISIVDSTQSQDDLMDSLMIAYNNDEVKYSKRILDFRKVIAKALGTQVVDVDPDPQLIEFPFIEKTDYGSWASNVYTAPNIAFGYYADITVSVVLNVTAYSGVGNGYIRLDIDTAIDVDSVEFTGTGLKYITLKATDSIFHNKGVLMDNVTISVYADTTGALYTATVLKASIAIVPVEYPQDETVNFSNLILPDITTFDLLKDYVIRTGSLIKYNPYARQIQLKSIENIIRDKHSAVDWTSKRALAIDEIELELSGFAQKNYFQDSNFTENMNARAFISFVNESVAEEKVYYNSTYKTINNEDIKSLEMANVNIFKSETDRKYDINGNSLTGFERVYEFDVPNSFVLIKTRDEESDDPVIKYGSTTATTYKVGEYLTWKELKEMFYGSLETALQRTKVIQRQYNLTELDVSQFDTFKLVYDDGAYYFVLQLKYVPDTMTNVKMLRVF